MREWKFPPQAERELKGLVAHFKDRSVFVVFQERDALYVKRVLDISPTVMSSLSELNTLISMMRASELIISMRLHGIILGYLLGKEVIGISYSHKVKGFCEDKGIRLIELDEIGLLGEMIEGHRKGGWVR